MPGASKGTWNFYGAYSVDSAISLRKYVRAGAESLGFVARQLGECCAVRGHGDLGLDADRSGLPGDRGGSVGRLMAGTGPRDGAAGAGPEGKCGSTRRCDLDASDDSVEPVGDRTESVVIEGGHAAWVKCSVRAETVPAFPDGGGAHGDGVEPRRAFGLQKQMVGAVEVAGIRQCVADERGPDEACGDTRVVLVDEFGKTVACHHTLCGLKKVEHDGEGVRGGAVARQAAVGLGVASSERRGDFVGECVVSICFACTTQRSGGTGEVPGGVGEVGGGDEVAVGAAGGGVIRWGGRVEPVP